jgi:hypothetical protein
VERSEGLGEVCVSALKAVISSVKQVILGRELGK